MIECVFCTLELSQEKIFYQDDYFVVMRTKTLKGHKERIMIVAKPHVHTLTAFEEDAAISILERVGRKIFVYAPKFVVMDSTFATIKEHWHLVATDLDPKSEDYEQILNTKWLKVVDRGW